MRLTAGPDMSNQMLIVKLGDEVSQSMKDYFAHKEQWIVVSEENGDECNLLWTDHTYDPSTTASAESNPRVRINHFHRLGVNQVVNKMDLALNIKRLKMSYPKAYNFLPQSFCLPKEVKGFENILQKIIRKENDSKNINNEESYEWKTKEMRAKWIIKPVGQNRGVGIYIFNRYDKCIYTDPVIAQRYISNPCLLAGYKFDFRLYVLVTSFWPLRCFIHKRGMVRFGTQPYKNADFGNLYAHLTNSSINQHSEEYNIDKDVIGVGSKWTTEQLWEYLKKQNHITSENQIWNGIKRVVLLTMLCCVGRVPHNPSCFEMFGFDVMLDSKWKPWLLEVNRSPAMRVSLEADRWIKPKLLDDTFHLLRMNQLIQEPEPDRTMLAEDHKEFDQVFPFNKVTEDISTELAKTVFGINSRPPPSKIITKYIKIIVDEVQKLETA